MKDLAKIVAEWPVMGTYSVAPADFPFCKKGTNLRVHPDVRIGSDRVRLGNWTTLEPGARIDSFTRLGEYAYIGRNAMVGRAVRLGDDLYIDEGATIERGVCLGSFSTIGKGAIISSDTELGAGAVVPEFGEHTIDLGWADGYRKCISEVAGVAIITAGCRTFTLDEALEHWGNHSLNRDLTMCLLESAQAIARIRGWAFSRKTTKKGRNHVTR